MDNQFLNMLLEAQRQGKSPAEAVAMVLLQHPDTKEIAEETGWFNHDDARKHEVL